MRVEGEGLRAEGLGFGVLESRVWGSGSTTENLGYIYFRVWGLVSRGLGIEVQISKTSTDAAMSGPGTTPL